MRYLCVRAFVPTDPEAPSLTDATRALLATGRARQWRAAAFVLASVGTWWHSLNRIWWDTPGWAAAHIAVCVVLFGLSAAAPRFLGACVALFNPLVYATFMGSVAAWYEREQRWAGVVRPWDPDYDCVVEPESRLWSCGIRPRIPGCGFGEWTKPVGFSYLVHNGATRALNTWMGPPANSYLGPLLNEAQARARIQAETPVLASREGLRSWFDHMPYSIERNDWESLTVGVLSLEGEGVLLAWSNGTVELYDRRNGRRIARYP